MTGQDNDTIPPTLERMAKAGDDTDEFVTDTGRRTVRLLDGSPIEMLYSRGAINADQYHAGCQIYADWYAAGLAASGVIDPARIVVDGGNPDLMAAQKLDAAGRFADAIKAIGIMHSHIVTEVVLFEKPLSEYGRERFHLADRKDAALAARIALVGALAELDLHYYGRRSAARVRTHHTDDYRPEIEAS